MCSQGQPTATTPCTGDSRSPAEFHPFPNAILTLVVALNSTSVCPVFIPCASFSSFPLLMGMDRNRVLFIEQRCRQARAHRCKTVAVISLIWLLCRQALVLIYQSWSKTDAGAGSGSHSTVRTALLVSVPVAVTLLVVLFFAVYICKKRKPHEHVQPARNRHGNEEMGNLESLQSDLSTLRAATDNFSEQNRLGEGAFGPVYKGNLQNGQEIAVKRMSKTSQQGQAAMENEVALVAKLQHKNLVRLLGYCNEKDERLLVYEFLSNKSLDQILYGPAGQWELSWEQRYKIIHGIGRGLMYLHEDSRLKIIHRDLKPGNILLDAHMNPKISDFGLAKLFHIDLSVANISHVAGTRGYMAPEYILHGILSAKSDVFSYGVLVLEVVTGRRPSEGLLKFVWRHWKQGNVPPLLDSCPADEPGQQQMLRCIHIGLLCVQDDPQLRPRMAAVVLMLNSRSMTMDQPTKPVFAITGERPQVAAPESSTNEASVSGMEPR